MYFFRCSCPCLSNLSTRSVRDSRRTSAAPQLLGRSFSASFVAFFSIHSAWMFVQQNAFLSSSLLFGCLLLTDLLWKVFRRQQIWTCWFRAVHVRWFLTPWKFQQLNNKLLATVLVWLWKPNSKEDALVLFMNRIMDRGRLKAAVTFLICGAKQESV